MCVEGAYMDTHHRATLSLRSSLILKGGVLWTLGKSPYREGPLCDRGSETDLPHRMMSSGEVMVGLAPRGSMGTGKRANGSGMRTGTGTQTGVHRSRGCS